MRTEFEMSEERKDRFLRIASEVPCTNGMRPERFMKLLETNTGFVSVLNRYGPDEHGLVRKNPVIAALGDSVTAGHFEALFNTDDLDDLMEKVKQGTPLEIVDLSKVYHERFRMMLAEKYGVTSLSVINAGIAGDNILGMLKRVYRDVIRYQPDLVIINGTLNWADVVGTLDDFGRGLTSIVHAIKENTDAEIVLLTPNAISDLLPDPLLEARVEFVRDLADREQACLVDVYKLWRAFTTDRRELRDCLANHINHPTAIGHQVYALALMQLFQ